MKQLRQLLGQWNQNEDESTPKTTAPDSHIGATEHQIALQLDRGARIETEISEVTPTEIRSKFVVQGVGITGIGVTPREKYVATGQLPAVGDVVMQEVEHWEYKGGQCVVGLRLVGEKPKDLPENSTLQALEEDRVESIEGG